MTNTTSLIGRYKSDSVETMSPGRLIVALYDRLLLDLERAVVAIAANDVTASHAALVHAQEIVSELHDALDVEGWPTGGAQIAAIYEFLLRELVTANVDKDVTRVMACHDLLTPLRDAWREAAGISAT
ncbi:MAG: flagellar export chaperone FliS [Actinomycetota bacterium]|nr:flagellar export chaperone FliS [Actinomycetota bacterium]